MHRPSRYPPAATRTDRSLRRLQELPGEVGSRSTRLELVCWQFNIAESRGRPTWDVALRAGPIAPAGHDRFTGEAVLGLTDRGRRAVRELRATRRR